MGQEAIFATLVNQTIETGNYLSELELKSLVESFIKDAFSLSRFERNLPEDGTYCLWVNEDLGELMRSYILTKKRNDLTASEFLKSLNPGKQLPITFNDKMASRRKLLHFITLRHPLAQAALDYWRERIDPAECFAYIGIKTEKSQEIPIRSGLYYFFLFTFHATGIEKISRLVPAIVVPQKGDIHTHFSRRLLHLLQTSADEIGTPYPKVDMDDLEYAHDVALKYMANQRDNLESEIRRNNEALVNARLEALSQSYEAKRRRIQGKLKKVEEPRIQRLYQGQLRNQKARYDAKRKEIEAMRKISVSFSLALRGMVKVEEEEYLNRYNT